MVFQTRTLALATAASLFAFSAPVGAAPPIAYAKEAGARFDLYLANPNGTGAVKLYTSAAKSTIGVVDMNPAANEVAIVESRATGFKIIHYDDAGVRTNVTTVDDGCYILYLDYHPSDGSLLVNRDCRNPQKIEIRRWASGAYGPVIISTDGQRDTFTQVRWLGDGSGFLVGYSSADNGAAIQRRNWSNPSAPTDIWTGPSFQPAPLFDVARCQGGPLEACSKLLYTDQSHRIHELTFGDTGGGTDTIVASGFDAHYSHDNSRILYRLTIKGGYTLNVTNPAQIAGAKATYNGKDWRP